MSSVICLEQVCLPVNFSAKAFFMIKDFRCKETEKLFNRMISLKLQNIERVARRKLNMLDAATSLTHLRIPPKNKLEALKGNRKGQHSIRINSKWRLCFFWHKGNAYNVEIVDYH